MDRLHFLASALDGPPTKRDTFKSVQTMRVRVPAPKTFYEIKIGAGLIANAGELLRSVPGPAARRAAVISNSRVFNLFGGPLVRALPL